MIRAIRAREAATIGAPALAAILAAASVMTAGAGDRAALAATGLVAVGSMIGASLLGWPGLVWLAVAVLATGYAVPVVAHSAAPWASVLYGLGLFLLAELGSLLTSPAARQGHPAPVNRLLGAYLVTVVAATLAIGYIALAAASLLRLGTVGELAGVAAAVATLSIVLGLVHQLGPSRARWADLASHRAFRSYGRERGVT